MIAMVMVVNYLIAYQQNNNDLKLKKKKNMKDKLLECYDQTLVLNIT